MQRLLLLLCACLSLTGCLSMPRELFDDTAQKQAQPVGFTAIRMTSDDNQLTERLEQDLRTQRQARTTSGPLSILALSGGGADGAFGAGVLNGWTKRGDRPEFDVVTGVSTGALIAPFAYLGSAYDDRLREAYTSGIATEAMSKRGVGALFTPGMFSSRRFAALVEYFVDVPMIEAIAAKTGRGGRLYVATTNLDTQSGVIWDIGAIATQGVGRDKRDGGDKGRTEACTLIRQILAASASVPGAFAPVMISTQTPDGTRIEEMHVDGSVTMPFFVLPESMLSWTVPQDLRTNARIYVLINGNVSPHFAVTRNRSLDVAARSLDTLTRAQARTTLISIRGFAARNGVSVLTASIPDDFTGGGLLAFDQNSMKRVFALGYARGVAGEAFTPDGV